MPGVTGVSGSFSFFDVSACNESLSFFFRRRPGLVGVRGDRGLSRPRRRRPPSREMKPGVRGLLPSVLAFLSRTGEASLRTLG